MLTAYIIAAIVGGGLILVSALGGLTSGLLDGVESDSDLDLDQVDFDNDVSLDGNHDISGHPDHAEFVKEAVATSEFWLPFFSLRFWIYFMATFGLIGSIATIFSLAASWIVVLVSVLSALVMGTLVAYVMRFLMKNSFDSSILQEDFLGVSGHILVPPRNGEPGKIRMSIKGETIDMLALPPEGIELKRGEEVVVVQLEGTKVQVARLNDIMGD